MLSQVFLNALIAGSAYALVALGFSVCYNIAKFINIGHGGIVLLAAYFAFLFSEILKLNFALALLLTLLLAVAFALAIDQFIFRTFRARKASQVILLIASIAVLLAINSAVLVFFGPATRSFGIADQLQVFNILNARATVIQLILIALAALAFFIHFALFKFTKIGKAMRAVSDNKEVAQIVGISVEKVYAAAAGLAAASAAVAGIVIGLDINLWPGLGTVFIIKAFAAVIIGGIGSVYSAFFGAYVLSFAENFGILFLPSGFKDAIAFALLFIFLLLRPQGLFGIKGRV